MFRIEKKCHIYKPYISMCGRALTNNDYKHRKLKYTKITKICEIMLYKLCEINSELCLWLEKYK